MMKKIIAAIVSLITVFCAGCQMPAVSVDPETTASPTATGWPDETDQISTTYSIDYDNRYKNSFKYMFSFAETESMYAAAHFLCPTVMYYSKENGENGILCGKPECLHNDDSCNAMIFPENRGFCYYEGCFWWLGLTGSRSSNSRPEFAVFQMNTDGTSRKKISGDGFNNKKTDRLGTRNTECIAFHRGYYYEFVSFARVSDAVPSLEYVLFRSPINEMDQVEEIFSYITQEGMGAAVFFAEKNAFVCFNGFNDDAEIQAWENRVFRIDIESHEVELILEKTGWDLDTYDVQYYNGRIYYSMCSYDNDRYYVYSVSDGDLEEVFAFDDNDMVFGNGAVGCGFALTIHYNLNGEGDYIWIVNYDGETLYKGKWDTASLGIDGGDFTALLVGGDEENIILYIDYGRQFQFVRIRIEDGRLEEEYLFGGTRK